MKHGQHFVQLFEADLPLKGGKIDVIAQNRRLKSGVEGVFAGTDQLRQPVKPGQGIAVAGLLFIGEPVVGKAEMPGQELLNGGGIVGSGHFRGAVAENAHQVPGEGRHLLLGAVFQRRLRVAVQQAQDALGVQSHTRISS